MIYERTELLKSFDGTELFFRCYTPKKRDRRARTDGLILAVHGFGEHSGRFQELAESVCSRNLALAAFDLRGHGKSGPRKGDADNLHAMVLDLIFMIHHTRDFFGIKSTDEQFFGVLGHSFGGLLATYAAAVMVNSCPPLLLTSPLFRMRQKMPIWRKLLTSSLPRVAPAMMQLPLVRPGEPVRQPTDAVPANASEPLELRSLSIRLEDILNQAMDNNRIRHSITLVHSPVTIVCGSADRDLDVDHVKGLFPLFASHETSLQMIDGAGHDLLAEQDGNKEQLLALLNQWIDNKGLCS